MGLTTAPGGNGSVQECAETLTRARIARCTKAARGTRTRARRTTRLATVLKTATQLPGCARHRIAETTRPARNACSTAVRGGTLRVSARRRATAKSVGLSRGNARQRLVPITRRARSVRHTRAAPGGKVSARRRSCAIPMTRIAGPRRGNVWWCSAHHTNTQLPIEGVLAKNRATAARGSHAPRTVTTCQWCVY